MMRKLFNGRTWALVAIVLAMFCSFAQAKGYANKYQYEGTLVEIQDRAITVINDEDKTVVHAVVPTQMDLHTKYVPGDKVFVILTKTNIGLWNLISIRKQ